MKKLIFTLILVSCIGAVSCSTANEAQRRQKKEIAAKMDSINAERAYKALADKRFVLSIDEMVFKHGGTTQTNPTVNYLSLDSMNAVIQISFPQAAPGFNGLGGITVEGAPRNLRYSVDKKGTATLMYVVSGKGLVADVTVRLAKDKTKASASIDAGYSTAGVTVYGKISPLADGWVVKGSGF